MTINFKSVTIKNFLSFGDEDTTIELYGQGFVMVKGLNQESSITQSNGSGKSAVFESIFWTITGSTLRGTTEVVNSIYNKDCKCSLMFEVDGLEYEITRYKKDSSYGNDCRVYKDKELISDQLKKSNDLISQLIPISSPDVLGSISVLGQGLPYRFSSLSPTGRKSLLETMSGSDNQIDQLRSALGLKEAEVASSISEKREEVVRTQSFIESQQSAINIYQEQLKVDPNEAQIEIANKELEIEQLSKNSESLKESISSLSDELSRLQEYQSTVQSNLTDYISKVKMIESEIQGIQSGVCPTCLRPYDNNEENEKRKSELVDQLTQFQQILAAINSKYSNVQSSITKVSQEISTKTNQITANTHQIERLRDLIKSITQDLLSSSKAQSNIEELNSNIKISMVKEADLKEELSQLSEIDDGISYLKRQLSREFKGYVLSEIINYLSQRTQYYSKYLFENKDITVTLSGNKILINLGDRLYENLSGGERQRVDLAVQFSLRDMLVVTTGLSCNLLVLDEVFDNLDSSGCDSLIRLVTSEFSDVDSVFVVTHHSEIDIPYDTILSVIKGSDKISRIEVN